MIKAIIFDWGGVLIDDPGQLRVPIIADRLGVSEQAFKDAYHKIHWDFQRGILSEQEFWAKLCADLDVPPPETGFWLSSMDAVFSEKKDVIDLICRLKKNDYKLCFLSNTERPFKDLVEKFHHDLFDLKIFSFDEGMVKPEPEIYNLALERLDVKPEEAIFVDDKERNTVAAEKLGIRSIIFKSFDQFKKELLEFGVKID